MKNVLWCIFFMMLMACLLLPVSAAENAEVTKGKQIATDAAKMTFPTDGSTCEAICPVHGTSVTWTPLTPGEAIVLSANTHYYLTDSVSNNKVRFTAPNKWNQYACLHLNGKSVALTGAMQVRGGMLNILGDGKVDFLGNTGTAAADADLFHLTVWGEKKLNIYGGTYTSSTGKGMMDGSGGNYTVNMIVKLYGNTKLDGLVTLTQSQLHLFDSATVTRIEATNTGSIRVDKDWRGSATVEYFTQITGDYISEYNGRSTGNFPGGLMLADGRRLVGENGKLRIVEASQLVLNDQQEGYCEACNKVVTWTAFSGNSAGTQNLGEIKDGVHHHYYLSADVNARSIKNFFLNLISGKVCLHLNSHDLFYGGYIMVGNKAILNVMGSGNMAFTATNTSNDYDISGLYANVGSSINLYGGTYSVAEDALEEGKPTIHIRDSAGQVTVNNATVRGTVNALGGTLTLEETARLENIQIGSVCKLVVDDSWTGSAAAEFEAPLTGNQIPEGNGSSTGAFSGKLTLADGRAVTGADGKLIIGGEAVPGNISYKLTETAELVSISGAGDFLLPSEIAGKPVTVIADGAFDSFTGTLYIGKDNAVGLAYAKEKGIAYTEVTSFMLENGVLQLQAAATELTFDKDTVLDLNGYSLNGVTVTNGTLYLMDTKTADFTVADGVYGKVTNITGNAQAAEGYLQITEEDGISFHRVDLDIYAMSLRASRVGVYYKSNFAADEKVAALVESYGVALSVTEAPDTSNLEEHCGYSVFTGFQAGKDVNAGSSTLLKNIMKEGISDQGNAARAAIPVYGRAYIKTADGYFFGEVVQRSLQEQVELADGSFETLTQTQKLDAKEMFDTYRQVMESWNIINIGNYKDRLWFKEPAPDTGAGFEQYSLPLGNGYTGISVFGGTESELLSVSDKTMFNPAITGQNNAPAESESTMKYGQGGLTNMCKIYIDFGHDFAQVTNYQRDLVLETAEAHVRYNYDGVTYNRTYFASYPDNVTVMKLDASESGKLSFTLRPEATNVRDYAVLPGDGAGKTGTVTPSWQVRSARITSTMRRS